MGQAQGARAGAAHARSCSRRAGAGVNEERGRADANADPAKARCNTGGGSGALRSSGSGKHGSDLGWHAHRRVDGRSRPDQADYLVLLFVAGVPDRAKAVITEARDGHQERAEPDDDSGAFVFPARLAAMGVRDDPRHLHDHSDALLVDRSVARVIDDARQVGRLAVQLWAEAERIAKAAEEVHSAPSATTRIVESAIALAIAHASRGAAGGWVIGRHGCALALHRFRSVVGEGPAFGVRPFGVWRAAPSDVRTKALAGPLRVARGQLNRRAVVVRDPAFPTDDGWHLHASHARNGGWAAELLDEVFSHAPMLGAPSYQRKGSLVNQRTGCLVIIPVGSPNMSLKERLELAMRRRGNPRKADLARAAKVSTASVADWFNGKTQSLKPEPARLAAAFFGCDRDWLGSGAGAPKWTDASPADFVLSDLAGNSTAVEMKSFDPRELDPPPHGPQSTGTLATMSREATSLALLFDGLPDAFLDGSTKREFFVRLVGLIQERPHLPAKTAGSDPGRESNAELTQGHGKRRGATHGR